MEFTNIITRNCTKRLVEFKYQPSKSKRFCQINVSFRSIHTIVRHSHLASKHLAYRGKRSHSYSWVRRDLRSCDPITNLRSPHFFAFCLGGLEGHCRIQIAMGQIAICIRILHYHYAVDGHGVWRLHVPASWKPGSWNAHGTLLVRTRIYAKPHETVAISFNSLLSNKSVSVIASKLTFKKFVHS